MGVAGVPREGVLEVVACGGEDGLQGHVVDVVLVLLGDDSSMTTTKVVGVVLVVGKFLPGAKLARAEGVGEFAEGLWEGEDEGAVWVDLLCVDDLLLVID